MKLLKDLRWRYACKKFDATRVVSDVEIEKLKEAISLTPTSFGLQQYRVLIVTDQEVKKQLLPHSWSQSQVVDASHLFVFCSLLQVDDEVIDDYLSLKSDVLNIPAEALKGYGDFMKTKLGEMPAEEMQHWTAKQSYMALSNLLVACAALQIDACPMEGFESEKYDEILGLTKRGLTASVIAPVGYRSEEDANQHSAKVRRPLEDMFEVV